MDAVAIPKSSAYLQDEYKIRAVDLPFILDRYPNISTLSLDCFDTLLWRLTAAPKDIFSYLQQQPVFQRLGVTAYQRIQAAAHAYRLKFASNGTREITLEEIYKNFSSLTTNEQKALMAEELKAEAELSFAFRPFIELIRQAKARNLPVVIVSDTYLTKEQLKNLLEKKLPNDVFTAISTIFCSSEFAKSKSLGLFADVMQTLSLPASSILHIGDHQQADFSAPQNMGLKALHFVQFDPKTVDYLRVQHSAAGLSVLNEPTTASQIVLPRYSPFRGLFASARLTYDAPQTLIGYMSFGPILYAFARFVSEEVAALERTGKKVKVFFLMRDAYLLAKACETLIGKPLGKSVHIRKFVSVAASFRTREDVDTYLASLTPQYYHFHVICEQLLLPKEITTQLIQLVHASPHPEKTFNELIHREDVLQLIFTQSTIYRERLKRYIQKEMQPEPGDTIVLVDTGYVGTTQKHLARALQDELNVEITGIYLIASHDPNRPSCKALLTSTTCDHGLFEQSCTYREGAVLDYDEDGNPIHDQIRLSDAQYEKVQAIQQECLRFIQDAKTFLSANQLSLPSSMLQSYALSALRRHVYLPLESEVSYFQAFQHDKDMGHDAKKTMFNITHGLTNLRHSSQPFHLHPYETRASHIETSIYALLQKTLQLDLIADDMSLYPKILRLMILKENMPHETHVKVTPTHDGFFSCFVPARFDAQIGVLFGIHFQWLQIESIQIMGQQAQNLPDLSKVFVFNQIENRGGNLFECISTNSLLLIMPMPDKQIQGYQIVFRPIIER